ncbi:MAG: tripartite tricarboxylate transporter substrate binding protein [Xanthobacteraceae bacterium]
MPIRAPAKAARLVAAVAAVLAVAPARAQVYPTRQIELVVPFVAGGTTDNIARMLAQRFSDAWRETVIVTNRPGGGATVGTQAVAKAAPDGHTLLVTTIAFATTPALQKLPYDAAKDFAPVTELAGIPLVLVVHASVPATTLREFILLAKAEPGRLDYVSSGAGTSTHLAAEMFNAAAGVKLVHVPFKGNAEGMNALLGGHVKVYFAQVPAVLQHVRAGTLRALAVTTEARLASLPDVPTIAELGFPGYEISSWQGMFAPAGTPKDVVAKISAEAVAMINTPEVRRRIAQEGADPVGSTPDQFAARVNAEIAKWGKVIRDAGIGMQ